MPSSRHARSAAHPRARSLAVLVALAVLAPIAPAPALAAPSDSGGRPAGERPQEPRPAGEEVVNLRDRFTTTYTTDVADEFRSEVASGPVHYRDGESWQPIDRALSQAGDGRFGNAGRNEFVVSVAPENQDGQLARLETKTGESVAFALEDARPGRAAPDPLAGAQTITYRGIRPHVDLQLTSQAEGLKEILLLQSAQAPTRYVFPLTLQGLSVEPDGAGGLVYRRADGKTAFRTPAPWMMDAPNERGEPGERSEDAAFRILDTAEGGKAVELTISPEWLADPARVFPVQVDPTYLTTYEDLTDSPFFYSDAYYRESNTSFAYKGSSTSYNLLAGASGSTTNDRYRAFVQFGGSDGITPNYGWHEVLKAEARVYQHTAMNCARDVYVKRVKEKWWGWEDYWAQFFGPPYDALDSATASVAGSCPPGYFYFDVTATAKRWEDVKKRNGTGFPNHGLALISSLSFTDSYRAYYSKEHSDPAKRPYLSVRWRNNRPEAPAAASLKPAPNAVLTTAPTKLESTYADYKDIDDGYNVYELRKVNKDGSRTAISVSTGNPTVCCGGVSSGTINATLGAGVYEYRAKSYDASYSEWQPDSGYHRFTVEAPPAAPEVSSTSHPDQSRWYTSASAALAWTEPASETGIAGYNWVHDTAATTLPPIVDPVKTTGRSASVTAPQGVSYFHVRAKNNAGQWGSTAGHYKLQVDSGTPSTPVISSPSHPDETNCYADSTPDMSWTASSSTSGIAGYSWVPDTNATTTPDSSPETAGLTASPSPLPDGTSYFHVKSLNNAGTPSLPDHYALRIDSTKPGLPSVSSKSHPDQAKAYPSTTVDMAWSASDTCAITGYSYVFDQTSTTVPDTASEGTETTKTFTAPQVVKGKDNYFHVRAVNGSGLWSDTARFRLRIYDIAPPEPLSPADGAIVPSPTPTLKVGAVTAPTGSTMSYLFQVSESTSFTTPLLDSGWLADTSYPVPTGKLTPGKTYYWQAAAKESGGGVGPFFSPPWSFTVNSAPPQTTAVSPDDGATVYTLTPDLVVNAVADPQKQAVGYRFEVASTSDFATGSVVADSGWQTGTTFTVPANKLSDAQKYYWRVATQDSMGASLGPWSLARSFTTKQLVKPELTKTVSAAQGSTGQALSPPAADGSTTAAHAAGEAVAYTVTVRNPNPIQIKVEKVTDTLPAQVAASGRVKVAGVDCLPTVCVLTGRTLTLPVPGGVIPAGGSVTFVYNGVLTGGERECLNNVANTAVASSSDVGDSKPAAASTTVCGAGLGVESWWSYVRAATGAQSEALVNAANGNLVVSATDSTPVQARGRLGYVLRRTYNSQETTVATLPGSLGAGWLLNAGFSGDLTGTGVTPTGLVVPRVGEAAEKLTEPLAVTLADRDGTRHTFTPKIGLSALNVLALPETDSLRPAALIAPASHPAVCLVTGYDAPPGVHLGLWRYVAVKPAVDTDPCGRLTATADTPADSQVVLGYAAVRPDRLRTEFAATGQLVGMVDGSGVRLDYVYYGADERNGVVTGPLRYVYERRSSDGEAFACEVQRSDLGVPRLGVRKKIDGVETFVATDKCRSFTFGYQGQDLVPAFTTPRQSADATDAADTTEVRDPAGRVTRYEFRRTGLLAGVQGPAMLLTAVVNPPQTSGGPSDRVLYRYQGDPLPDGTTLSCGGSGYQLCEITDARGATTKTAYTRPQNDAASSLAGLGRVATLTDRRGTQTKLAYSKNPDGTTTTVALRGDEQERTFSGIDAFGRAGKVVDVDAAALARPVLHDTALTWDSDTASCTRPAAGRDNNLCAQVREGGASPDEDTSWTYNADGMVLRARSVSGAAAGSGTPAVLDTTFGYATQHWTRPSTGGSAPVERTQTVAGGGQHNDPAALTAAEQASVLFTVTDRTQQLSARGNEPTPREPYERYITAYTVDRAATSPNAVPAGDVCAGTAGNTGLVCAVTVPVEPEAATKPGEAVTTYTYDAYGQRLTMRTPNAQATGDKTYQYGYAGRDRRDLSGTVSAEGWLVGVTDPDDKFVAFAHDAAGNTVRTWDRNATAAYKRPDGTASTLADFPGTLTAPTTTRYAETLYATGSPDKAIAAPWRWAVAERAPTGDTTARCVDAHGNPRLERPARGTGGQPITDCPAVLAAGPYDVLYDTDNNGQAAPDDRTTSVLQPEQRAAGQPATAVVYDPFGNATQVTDARGVPTVTEYDKVNRPVKTTVVRATTAGELPAGADSDCPATATHASVCTTTTGYDMVDNPVRTEDPDKAITTAAYNAVHWKTETRAPGDSAGHVRDAGTGTPGSTELRTAVLYDADGNPTSVCPPREFGPDPGAAGPTGTCTGTGAFSRHYRYDPSGRMLDQTVFRAPGTPALVTGYRYDLNGNQTSVTDANGHTTRSGFDRLDRPVALTRPRSATAEFTTTMRYDPVGNRTSVTEDLTTGLLPTSRTDAYSYDAANRLVDRVTGASSPDANAAGTATGEQNVRTRTVYDADSRPVGSYAPRAFAASTTDPDERFLTWTDVDRNGRPVATFTPRHDGGTGTAGTEDSQATECSAEPGKQAQPTTLTGGAQPYPAGVGVCTTRMAYDQADRMIAMTLPTAGGALPGSTPRQLAVGYTADGLRTKVTAPSPTGTGTVDTVVGFDAAGRPVKITAPPAPDSPDRTTTMAYTPDGLLAARTEPPVAAGGPARTTKLGYDLNGQQTRTIDPLNQVSTSSWTADGLPAGSTDPGGFSTRYRYDNVGNTVRVWDRLASQADDARKTDGSKPAGVPTAYTYTADNLVATEARPHRPDGNRLEVSWDYDGAGRKTAQRMRTVAGFAGDDEPRNDDPALRVLVADGGTQTFGYSAADRLAVQTGRNNETIRTGYDPDGNPLTIADSTLDSANAPSTITSTFYLDGLLRSAGDGKATTRYGYDGAGQISVREHGPDLGSPGGATVERTTFGYNDAGARTTTASSTTVPKDGKWTAAYDPAGRLTRESAPNGQVTTQAYNPDDSLRVKRTTADASATAALVAEWAYSYDALGRLLRQDHAGQLVNGAEDSDHRYGYDPAGRVIEFADGPGASRLHTAAFDANGNRTSYKSPEFTLPQLTTYSPDNALATTTDLDGSNQRASGYTAFGALEADGCYRYGYDGFDRLTKTTGDLTVTRCATAPTTSYAYDGLDRQRQRTNIDLATDPADTTDLHYDGLSTSVASQILLDGTGASTSKTFTLDPAGQPVGLTNKDALLTAPSTAYLTDDGTGTITTITGDQPTSPGATADGFTTCTARFDPWGTPTTTGSTADSGTPGQRSANPCGTTLTGTAGDSGNDRFYRAERRDTATGNYQLGPRTYDPSRTGFLTPDSHRTRHPVADLALGVDPLTTNRYNYVNGDPVNYTDPTGHEPRIGKDGRAYGCASKACDEVQLSPQDAYEEHRGEMLARQGARNKIRAERERGQFIKSPGSAREAREENSRTMRLIGPDPSSTPQNEAQELADWLLFDDLDACQRGIEGDSVVSGGYSCVILGAAGWGKLAKLGKVPGAGKAVPLGFKDLEHFSAFGSHLGLRLKDAGYEDVTAILQGSAVSGKNYNTGVPFDGKVGATGEAVKSDFDVALASPALLERAKSAGIRLRGAGARTGPLTERDLKKLGLWEVSREMSSAAGRPVNFMIYGSADAAFTRSGGVRLP